MPIERRLESSQKKDVSPLDSDLNQRLRRLLSADASAQTLGPPEKGLERAEIPDDLLKPAPTATRENLVADDVNGVMVKADGSKLNLDVILSEDCSASQFAAFERKSAGGVLVGLGPEVTGRMAELLGRQPKPEAKEAGELLGKATGELSEKGCFTEETGTKILDRLAISLHVGKPAQLNR